MTEPSDSSPPGESPRVPPRKRVTRRRFLVFSGVTLAVVGVGGFVGKRRLDEVIALVRPEFLSDGTPTGELGADTLSALIGVTDAVIGMRFTPDVYVDFFRWRAQNVHGYKRLYERFVATLQARARPRGIAFTEGDTTVRAALLADVMPHFAKGGAVTVATAFVAASDEEVLFFRYVVLEILLLFMRTDAYVHVGYDAWPGVPRGLEIYRRAPATAATPASTR